MKIGLKYILLLTLCIGTSISVMAQDEDDLLNELKDQLTREQDKLPADTTIKITTPIATEENVEIPSASKNDKPLTKKEREKIAKQKRKAREKAAKDRMKEADARKKQAEKERIAREKGKPIKVKKEKVEPQNAGEIVNDLVPEKKAEPTITIKQDDELRELIPELSAEELSALKLENEKAKAGADLDKQMDKIKMLELDIQDIDDFLDLPMNSLNPNDDPERAAEIASEMKRKKKEKARIQKKLEKEKEIYAASYIAFENIGKVDSAAINLAKQEKEDKMIKNFVEVDKKGRLSKNIDTILVVEDAFRHLSYAQREKYKFLLQRGVMKLNNGMNHKEAIKFFNKSLELAPESHEALQLRANSLIALDKFKYALKDLNKVEMSYKSDPVLYYNIAIAHSKQGDFETAVKNYDKALELDPDYLLAYQGRASALTVLGDYSGAIDDYDVALDQNPYFTSAYKGRGVAKAILGYFDDAIFDFSLALELNPEDAQAYMYRGLAYHSAEDPIKACEDLDIALEKGLTFISDRIKKYCE